MYAATVYLHIALAFASLAASLWWILAAWQPAGGAPAGRTKAAYSANRAVSGIAGLSGLALMAIASLWTIWLPYVGLGWFLAHGVASTVSKRAFATQRLGLLRAMLLIQFLCLVAAALKGQVAALL